MATNKGVKTSFSIDSMLESLKRYESVRISWVNALCDKSKEILMKEETLLTLSTPITVCGDIHGQFQDLMELFTIGGDAPYMSYLFLGDYVDRGYNGVETFLFLLGLKVKYPSRVFLLRGNHESKEITQVYGFYDECLRKFGSISVWQNCLEVFNVLSLGAIIDNKILAIHGGLSPSLSTLDKLRTVDRFHEVPHDGLMSDLLWSDPDDAKGWNMSPRGAGFLFGADIVDQFRQENAIDYICRAHQLVLEGFKWHFKNTVLTVWSAPNYCYRCGNIASIFELAQGLQGSFTLFEAAPMQIYKAGQMKKLPAEYFL